MDLSIRSETFGQDDQTWIGAAHGIDLARSISLDTSAFVEGTHYPDGYLKSGLPLGRITATGLYAPYGGSAGVSANEVQTIGLGAAAAGTVTIGFDGETTAAIAFNATAGAVQTALELLSNVDAGDIVVTGGPFPGVITLTFGGQYAGVNVPTVVVTPSGLTSGTVTVTPVTAGGSASADGTDVLAGFLLTPIQVPANHTTDVGGALYEHGRVVEANLPIAIDAPAKADVAGRITFE